MSIIWRFAINCTNCKLSDLPMRKLGTTVKRKFSHESLQTSANFKHLKKILNIWNIFVNLLICQMKL